MDWKDLQKQAGKVAENAGSFAQGAARKAKVMVSIAKLKVNISAEEDKLKKAYTELGRLYYRDYAAQSPQDAAEYLPWCDKAAEAKQETDRLYGQVAALKASLDEQPADPAPETPAAGPVADETPTVGTLYVDMTHKDEDAQ